MECVGVSEPHHAQRVSVRWHLREKGPGLQEGTAEDEKVRQLGRSQVEQEPWQLAGPKWKRSKRGRSLARGDKKVELAIPGCWVRMFTRVSRER